MTVLSTDTSRFVGTAVARLPRVNLLPPEIAERALMRRVQAGLGCAVLATVGVVVVLTMSASHSVSSAQSSLDSATAQGTQLQAESSKYQNVTALYAAADAAQAQLTTAMGEEVRYSQLLNDLSLSVPSTVWLKSLAINQAPGAAPAPGAAATSPAIGTLSVSAVGFQHDDLALWLDSIGALKTYSDPSFASSAEGLIGKRKVVNFSGTANLVAAAESGRYTRPVGG